jgi:hypothetical protein
LGMNRSTVVLAKARTHYHRQEFGEGWQ